MNDPGLDDPINESAKKIEDERKEEKDVEREDEQAFLNPRFEPQQPSRTTEHTDTWKQSMVVRLNGLSITCSTFEQWLTAPER